VISAYAFRNRARDLVEFDAMSPPARATSYPPRRGDATGTNHALEPVLRRQTS